MVSAIDKIGQIVLRRGRTRRGKKYVGEGEEVIGEGHLRVDPEVVARIVVWDVAVQSLKRRPDPSGYHPHGHQCVLWEQVVADLREGGVGVLPDPEFDCHQSTAAVVRVRLRPGTRAAPLDVIFLYPVIDDV